MFRSAPANGNKRSAGATSERFFGSRARAQAGGSWSGPSRPALALGGAEAVGFGGGCVSVAAVGVGAAVGHHPGQVVDAAVHLGLDRMRLRAVAADRLELGGARLGVGLEGDRRLGGPGVVVRFWCQRGAAGPGHDEPHSDEDNEE